MRCDEFENRLNEALDARRDPSFDPRLARHLENCRQCRQLAAAMDAIGESLRWSERPDTDDRLADKVLAQLAAPVAAPASSRSWSVWTHVSLAAAVALLAMIVLPERRPPAPQRPMIAETAPSPAEALARVEPAPDPIPAPVGELAREATSRYASLAHRTSQSLSDVWSLWQPAASRTADEPQSPELALADPLLAEMASGLRPLADSTSGAMELLFNLLPQNPVHSPAPPAPVADPVARPAAT